LAGKYLLEALKIIGLLEPSSTGKANNLLEKKINLQKFSVLIGSLCFPSIVILSAVIKNFMFSILSLLSIGLVSLIVINNLPPNILLNLPQIFSSFSVLCVYL
jgi:hypothetical protein